VDRAAGHVARTGVTRNADMHLVGKPVRLGIPKRR
jgi:hypothetical protein